MIKKKEGVMEKEFNSICVVSQGYPTKVDPYFTFVEELCTAFSKQGKDVTVIAPQSFTSHFFKGAPAHPTIRIDEVEGGSPIHIYQPWMITVPFRFLKINDVLFTRAVKRAFEKLRYMPDVLYSHFWNNGLYISKAAKKHNLPLFVASGEGNFDVLENIYTQSKYLDFSKNVRGVICVSSHTRDCSIKLGLTTADKCIVLPNSIDSKKFFLRNKHELRKKYGYSDDAFIVAFVGSFINRKGSNRLSAAIESLNDDNIKSFFIGMPQGPENLIPTCKGVLKCGKVNHNDLPEYLSMADVFALPTLNEGCCNAIIEALACGLPVISSNLPFNWDVLDSSNSIMINPNSIEEIASAIKKIKDDESLRVRLSEGAIKRASALTIENRAKSIISFISIKLKN